MTESLRPVAVEERIHALDLLRGWAMFGVLWSNLNDHYGVRDPAGGLDRAPSGSRTTSSTCAPPITGAPERCSRSASCMAP